jgi:NAD(P)-dependent dehydrogenase (short-subunit alcohol dehydrogenase family)
MDLQLSGKLALVTGSTAGIGLAIGSTLAGEGATVIINGRSETRVIPQGANGCCCLCKRIIEKGEKLWVR